MTSGIQTDFWPIDFRNPWPIDLRFRQHQVKDLFNGTKAKEMVDISNQETGWLEN